MKNSSHFLRRQWWCHKHGHKSSFTSVNCYNLRHWLLCPCHQWHNPWHPIEYPVIIQRPSRVDRRPPTPVGDNDRSHIARVTNYNLGLPRVPSDLSFWLRDTAKKIYVRAGDNDQLWELRCTKSRPLLGCRPSLGSESQTSGLEPRQPRNHEILKYLRNISFLKGSHRSLPRTQFDMQTN